MRTAFTQRIYLPLLDRARATPFRKALHELRSNEKLPLEKLQELQVQQLRSLLAHAREHSPFHAERMRVAGLEPQDVTDISCLRALPVLEKNTLYDHYDNVRSRQYPGKKFSGSTSGSTGIALRFEYDSIHDAVITAAMWRHRGWWGLRRGDREAELWGRPLKISEIQKRIQSTKYWLRNIRHFYTFGDFDEAQMESMVKGLRKFRPKLVYGYGSSLARLARFMTEKGERLEGQSRPILVEFTADHMHAAEQAIAEEAFGCPVASQYGASETPSIAGQCPQGGMHIAIDQCILEFVRADGTAAGPGEHADLVVTPLYNFAMPLIRYRVGDAGAYSDDKCPCGLTLPLMNLTIGKSIELITTSTAAGVSAHILDYANLLLLRKQIPGLRQFFIEQTDLDRFRLDYVSDGAPARPALASFIATMREHLGEQIAVECRSVSEIPAPASGKRRYFKNSCAKTS